MPTLEETKTRLEEQLKQSTEALHKQIADSPNDIYQLQTTLQCLKPVSAPAAAARETSVCARTSSCAGHYRQMAFLLPFSAVYLMNAFCDPSPCNCAVSITAGLLAGGVGYGLYRAIKMVKHIKS